MSEQKPSYVAAAFSARPFGMPIPPNWFALAAIGLLGAFVNPGIWLIGAGLEGIYLWSLSRHPRFRAVVDATSSRGSSDWTARYETLVARLDDPARRTHEAIERQATELSEILARSGANPGQIADVRQMVWLHLKLLAARGALTQVAAAGRERQELDEQAARLKARLAHDDADAELRRSLEQQLAVIESRRAAHGDAARRRELVDAELERLRQQIALVREQALLATDERSVAGSLDALAASLNEANRWLKDQRELFAGLDDLTDEPPPPDLLRPRERRRQRSAMEESA
jgi:hypothetical protein